MAARSLPPAQPRRAAARIAPSCKSGADHALVHGVNLAQVTEAFHDWLADIYGRAILNFQW